MGDERAMDKSIMSIIYAYLKGLITKEECCDLLVLRLVTTQENKEGKK
ncbi:MAG: hypothetical protein GXN91_01210 [Epsilonproteobacteria bacterium]|nr:hypothetical protein [Campylobacterota bacterium]